MKNEIATCYKILKQYHNILSRQQILTFKGQIKAGDYNGFKRGINKVINK